MIDLYVAPTPNGWKAAIMLEETRLVYRPILMRLSARPSAWESGGRSAASQRGTSQKSDGNL